MNSKLTLMKFSDHEKIIGEISHKLGLFEDRVWRHFSEIRKHFEGNQANQMLFVTNLAQKIDGEVSRLTTIEARQKIQELNVQQLAHQFTHQKESDSGGAQISNQSSQKEAQTLREASGMPISLRTRIEDLERRLLTDFAHHGLASEVGTLRRKMDDFASEFITKMEDRSVEVEIIAMNAKFERRLVDIEQYLAREFGDESPGNLKQRLVEVELLLEADLSGLSVSENNVSIDPERASKPSEYGAIRMVQRLRLELEDKFRGLEERVARLSLQG
jgi:hypothetical protein